MRLSIAVAVSCLILTGLSAAEPAAAAIKKQTSISAQSLDAALRTLAKERDFQVLYRSEVVGDRRTAGAVGELSFDEALTKLLSGSGLTFQYLDDKTVTILPVVAPGASPSRAPKLVPSGESQAQNQPELWEQIRLAQVGDTKPRDVAIAAAAETTRLEEIIVTAQKRAERLQDVPVAVSAVDAEKLVNSNLLRIEDYYARLPGVSLTMVGSGSEPMVIIRGMTTFVGSTPTTGTVIDEVSYGRSSALGPAVTMPDIDPGDLERVEVLRGPQGTLYGASSMGGLLKFVTKDPSTEGLSGRLQVGSSYVEKSNEMGRNIRGSVNVPLNDTLAVRLSGFTQHDPGYIDNVETGERDINDRDSDGGRLSALWRPGENFSLKLSAMWQDSERHGPSDVNRTLLPDFARSGLPGIGGSERKTSAYSATAVGSIGSVELVSATGYSVDELNNSFEFTVGALPVQAATRFPGTGRVPSRGWFEDTKFSQELRASLPIGDRLNWLTGLYYTEEKNQASISIYASGGDAVPVGLLVRNLTVAPTSFEERAVFTNLTVDITDRFDVQFGGRFSENKQVFSRASVLLGTHALDAAPNFFEVSRSKDSPVTYLFTSRFRVSPELMTYVRVASGYRPGGPNFNCGLLPADLCEFDADTSTNYEIGVKGTLWNRRLSFDTAVYYIDWKDLQVGPLLLGANLYLTNASRARAQGVELSVEAKPWTGMDLSASVTYNDAELAEPMPSQFGNGSTFVPKGTQLPFSAPWTGSLSADQSFPLAIWNEAKGVVGVTASYVDERLANFPSVAVNAPPQRPKPSYVQVDFRAGVTYGTWEVNAFVNNVTDKRGVLRGGDDGLGANLVNYIQPRTIGLSMSKDF